MRLKKIEKTRLRRLLRKIEKIRLIKKDWKIEKDWEERFKGLKKQDWIDWEDKIEERLHQSYQSSSIWKI